MINEVRSSVLSILNKNNYGYVTPADFNLWAKLAQLEVFKELFEFYNRSINQENARLSGMDYADLGQILEESIDNFSVIKPPQCYSQSNSFARPSIDTTGDIAHLINVSTYWPTQIGSQSTATSTSAGQLVDSSATFQASGVEAGDLVVTNNQGFPGTAEKYAFVRSVVSDTVLNVDSDVFVSGDVYRVLDSSATKICERLSRSRERLAISSSMYGPSAIFPAYAEGVSTINAYPVSITGFGSLVLHYIRLPKDPKWTYVQFSSGEPSFNASSVDYQDFEIHEKFYDLIVNKIVQYAATNIREIPLQQVAKQDEMMGEQSKK
jgi:hypothetical protein